MFVVSKVAAEHKTYEEAKAGIDETLKKMGLDYLDMMIIHSPQPWVEVNQSENRYKEGNRQAWRALEEAYNEGKLKVIGVSNFQIEDLESLMATAKIKPMVNQVLCHISNTPVELIEFCQKSNIAVEAYSPIAHGVILNQLFFVKHFSLKKASKFPVFSTGISLLLAGTFMHPCA